jgi:hypothetical protein
MRAISSHAALFAVSLAAVAAGGCEDKAIGRVCDVQAPDAGSQLAVFNGQALECPSRICLRPSKEPAVARLVDTAPLCTAECSKDSDCEDGETRDGQNPRDRRCKTKWVCGVAFEVGPLCCKKLCMCQDFLPGPPQTPPSCVPGNTVSTCANIK